MKKPTLKELLGPPTELTTVLDKLLAIRAKMVDAEIMEEYLKAYGTAGDKKSHTDKP